MRTQLLLLSLAILTPAASAAPASRLEAARERLAAVARETDPDTARRRAAELAPELRAISSGADASCTALVLTAECELRAGEAAAARATLARAKAAQCDPGIVAQLSGWALEFNDAGVRRGAGAPLLEAETSYFEAALRFGTAQPPLPGPAASALLKAAELAHLRGDRAQCGKNCIRGLGLKPPVTQRVALGLEYLRCTSPLEGEGAALDALQPHLDSAELQSVGEARLEELRRRLDETREDGVALAAVAHYTWIARELEQNVGYTERYLTQAAAVDENLPDLWYQFGRIREFTGRWPEAKDNYRRQVRQRPGLVASRLAANQFAMLVATNPSTPAERDEALALVNAEIARAPGEGALLDTRAHVLMALGRDREALADLERALALTADPETARTLEKLKSRLATPRR